MKHDEKIKLALAAKDRITAHFDALTADPLLKQSMSEAADKMREMRQPKQTKRA